MYQETVEVGRLLAGSANVSTRSHLWTAAGEGTAGGASGLSMS